jgi:hypothetical protein
MFDTRLRASPAGRRRALCIGIDSYRRHPLAGAQADALAWSTALQQLGFASPVMLTNHNATRQAILDAWHTLVTSSVPGDAIVLEYAGHGTLVTDIDGDELASAFSPTQDEAICPVDFDRDGLIIDDEIGRILDLLPSGVSATCFFDCCHAASMTRDGGPGCPVPRTLALRPIEIERHHERGAHARAPSQPSQPSQPIQPRCVRDVPEVGYYACRSDELAWETQGRGDFTRHALDVLRTVGDDVTNEGFLNAVIASLGSAARQTPMLICAPALRGARLFAASA